MKISIVWLRRNLRLHDNKPLSIALTGECQILPVFIFDSNILARFNNPYDRRLSFISNILFSLNRDLKTLGGELLVMYGDPSEIIPVIAQALPVHYIYADEDFEPDNIKRDKLVSASIRNLSGLQLSCDHLLFRAGQVKNKNGEPYKVYTPYMQEFRRLMDKESLQEYECNLNGRLVTINKDILQKAKVKIIKIDNSPAEILEQVGYKYVEDKLWQADAGNKRLHAFIASRIETYKDNRDRLDMDGTSRLSPYLRFGTVSVRECYRLALGVSESWINELVWREFYASILYHFPDTITQEFILKYRGRIPWQSDTIMWEKFTTGQTGYPIIDAAIRQLLQEGWMHNRARMITASFLTKNLLMDWRLGEEFFAQHLMDYELSSNVGGWQWSASCGTDAQPYFRIFNPFLQGEKFDPTGKYIKKYVPELKFVPPELLHNPKAIDGYHEPIVDYKKSRAGAITAFKNIG